MGFIRGGLLVIASVLFFVSLLLVNSFFTISSSLEYDNIQKELVPVVTESLESEIGLSRIVEGKMPEIQSYCENNSEFVFSQEGETFTISCEAVNQGAEAVVQDAVSDFAEEVYYENYDCSFFECLKENQGSPFFLISEKTKNYFQGKMYMFLGFAFILLVAMFFLVESKTNLPLIAGILMIVSSLPFLKLGSIVSFFADKSFLKFFSFLFTEARFVFLVSFILGLILVGIGILLKFFVVGFKISDLFSKFKKEGSDDKTVKKDYDSQTFKKDDKKEIKKIKK